MCKVKTFDGRIINPLEEAKFLEPVVELSELAEPRDAKAFEKWQGILNCTENTSTEGILSAKYYTGNNDSYNIIEQGKGISTMYRGQLKRLNPSCDRNSQQLAGYGPHDKYYRLFVFTLCRDICNKYLYDSGLDVNHTIIPQGKKGTISNEVNLHLYEVIGKDNNRRHAVFVRNYNLLDTPVSIFDRNRLIELFKSYGVDEVTIDEDYFYEDCFLNIRYNPTMNKAKFRRTLCWIYYIQHHTPNDKLIWQRFYKYYNNEYSQFNGNWEDLKEYVLGIINFLD